MTRGDQDLLGRNIAELLAQGPEMAEAFKRAGLAACLGCAMATFESLGEAVQHYQLDAVHVLREIGGAAGKGGHAQS